MFQSGNNDTFDVQERHMCCGGYWLQRVSGDTSEDKENGVYTQIERKRRREREVLFLSLLLEFTLASAHQPLRPSSSEACLVCGPAHFFLVYMNQGCTCE